LVAKRPDGQSSKGRNDQDWGNEMSRGELSKWRNVHKSLGQFIVARDRPTGEPQIQQKMVHAVTINQCGWESRPDAVGLILSRGYTNC